MLGWIVAAEPHLNSLTGVLQFEERQFSCFSNQDLSDLRRVHALLGFNADPALAAGRANSLAVKVSREVCQLLPLEVDSLQGISSEVLKCRLLLFEGSPGLPTTCAYRSC